MNCYRISRKFWRVEMGEQSVSEQLRDVLQEKKRTLWFGRETIEQLLIENDSLRSRLPELEAELQAAATRQEVSDANATHFALKWQIEVERAEAAEAEKALIVKGAGIQASCAKVASQTAANEIARFKADLQAAEKQLA